MSVQKIETIAKK